MHMASKPLKIIFYDGDCGLCQRSVIFLARVDKRKTLLFAPLNGMTYQAHFVEAASKETVLYFADGNLFTKSSAIIECLSGLGGVFKAAAFLKIVPPTLRDRIYDWAATHRRKVSCPILKKDERFLN